MDHRYVGIPLIVWMAAVLMVCFEGTVRAVAERTVTVDGRSRKYLLHVPQELCEPSPLVLVFHGGGGNAANMPRLGFEPLAERDGFVVAYPEGVDGHWNDGRQAESLQAQREDINDVNFVRKIVDDVRADHKIDRSRIFATGVLNGGIFCHRLAAEASDLVAAIAPVIGGMAEPVAERFQPAFPVSMLAIQGDADPLVPFGGGEIGLWPSGRRGRIISATETVGKYLTLNGIVGEPNTTFLPDLDPQDGTATEVTAYPPGPQGFLVELYVVHGGGHQWPGHGQPATAAFSGKASGDFDATEVIWEFFRSCPPGGGRPMNPAEAPAPVTSLEEVASSLPSLARAIRTARGDGQVYVSQQGRVLANRAWGTYEPNTLVGRASATKPTTCVVFMQLVEEGLLGLDDLVSQHVPGFEQNGKAPVKVRHLLTHTGHLSGYDGPLADKPWDQVIADIIAAPLAWERSVTGVDRSCTPVPGEHPTYSPPGIWMLGEILRIKRGVPFDRLIREELYVLCGMGDCFNGMTNAELQEYTSGIPAATARTKPDLHWANPAGGTLGPTWQLGRFYEMVLLGKGKFNGRPILQPQTVEDMTSLQAGEGLWYWGLGFNLNYAGERYGSEASAETFGHNGASGMIAFADPQAGLVVAAIGLSRDTIDSIYKDLGH